MSNCSIIYTITAYRLTQLSVNKSEREIMLTDLYIGNQIVAGMAESYKVVVNSAYKAQAKGQRRETKENRLTK